MNRVARALQIGQERKSAECQEEGDDRDDATGISDDGELEVEFRVIKENCVEIHENGEVGEVIAGTFRVRLVGGNEMTTGCRPTAERVRLGGGGGGGGGVIPENATN